MATPSARVCRVGVWFRFVRSALLLAAVTCIVLSFEAMPGLCCVLRVTHTYAYRFSGFSPYDAVCSITLSIRNIRNCNIRRHTAVIGKSCTPAKSAVIKTRSWLPQPRVMAFSRHEDALSTSKA